MENPKDFVTARVKRADFVLLRIETEFTPCTGITAVSKQERRHFKRCVMIAPWVPRLRRSTEALNMGEVVDTGWFLSLATGIRCKVLTATDAYMPTFYLSIDGSFSGEEHPYDVAPDVLRRDALIFGLAVEQFMSHMGSPGRHCIWGADWECVPALIRLRGSYATALTLHNTFDECLETEARQFGALYEAFGAPSDAHPGSRTALEIGLANVDVVTAVNRGFAYGIRAENIQRIMAPHLQHLAHRVVGIDNAAFSALDSDLLTLKDLFQADFAAGRDELFALKQAAISNLPEPIRSKATGKVLFVSMGRRVAQKQHDVLVESIRGILSANSGFPIFVVFATVDGDHGSAQRLVRMQQLEEEFPDNVCVVDRIPYYATLMQAADYNVMPSLWEPHGGAFEGIVVPLARAVDGLAEQICAFEPMGEALRLNALWHSEFERPTGFLFREADTGPSQMDDFRALLKENPSPHNAVFQNMVMALSETLNHAISTRIDRPDDYARIVMEILDKQGQTSWQANFGGMSALLEQSRQVKLRDAA